MHAQKNTGEKQDELGNNSISKRQILKSDSALSGFLSGTVNTAVNRIILDDRVTIRHEQLLGVPSLETGRELKKKGYDLTIEINGTEIIKGLFSELEPYYYIPHVKNPDGTVTKISGDMLKSMYHDMEGGNEYEQMAVLSEKLDMPADVFVFMMNGF